MSAETILRAYGEKGVQLLKTSIAPIRATGKTEQSIRFESDANHLRILARGFFTTIETGRGPRKSAAKGDFLENMLDYMRARSIGADLTEKKRRQLARFLTLKINREGDKTYKKGGREIYSEKLDTLVKELSKELTKDFVKVVKADVVSVFK